MNRNILRTLFPFLPLIIATSAIHSQDPDITDIRNKYAEIHSHLKSYQIKKTEISGESTEGGALTAYFDNTLIRLIIGEYFGETGKRVIEYYYFNQHLIFIYDMTLSYNRPINMDSASATALGDTEWYVPSKSIKKEERFYFKNDRLIRWLDNSNQPVTIQSGRFNQKSDEMIIQSNKVLSIFFNREQ